MTNIAVRVCTYFVMLTHVLRVILFCQNYFTMLRSLFV
jgi:hypothetical protein